MATVYDVFVIGGGVNGCGIARDAAGRGYSVYLSEKKSLRLIGVKPVKDKKELALEFPLPIEYYQYYNFPTIILRSLCIIFHNNSVTV